MECIALTGGIATGKSTVSALIRRAGIPVIDADELAREVVWPASQGLRELVAEFGEYYLLEDGSLNRQKLSDLIFAVPEAREKVEAILHPRIGVLLVEKLAALDIQGFSWVVYEAPLIFEKKMQDNFFATLLVTCSEKIQQERLMRRDKVSLEVAQQRINSQLSDLEKRKLATVVLDTDCSEDQLPEKLAALWLKLTGQQLTYAV